MFEGVRDHGHLMHQPPPSWLVTCPLCTVHQCSFSPVWDVICQSPAWLSTAPSTVDDALKDMGAAILCMNYMAKVFQCPLPHKAQESPLSIQLFQHGFIGTVGRSAYMKYLPVAQHFEGLELGYVICHFPSHRLLQARPTCLQPLV